MGSGVGVKVTTDADIVTVCTTVSGSGGGALEEGTGLGGAEEGYIRVKPSPSMEWKTGIMYHIEKRTENIEGIG